MERKIYNGWAFSENELDKGRINEEIYNELIEKYKIYRSDTNFNPDINYDDYDIIIGRKAGYNHAVYNIIKNSPGLPTDGLLLICDGGNLCFGGSKIGKNQLRVSED